MFETSAALNSALTLVGKLNDAGHEAYLVGGCVRDTVLCRPSKDYDVTTSATPEQVAKVFPGTEMVGAHFGVSLVLHEGVPYEVATFRMDGAYSDNRRPDSVMYTTDVMEDLKRRDFTFNAMLMNRHGEILDPMDGKLALDMMVVKTVGDAKDRFKEDALRMLRAVRFASQLGFQLDQATKDAIRRHWQNILDVSKERVQDELTKILTSGHASYGVTMLVDTRLVMAVLPDVAELKGCEQNPKYHPEGDVYTHTMGLLDQLKPGCSETLAWAALLHDIGKPRTSALKDGQPTFYDHETVGAEMARGILNDLRMSNDTVRIVYGHIAQHMKFRSTGEMRRSKLLRFVGQPHFAELLELHKMDSRAGSGNLENAEFVEKVLSETPEEVLHPPKLVTGMDLINRGVQPGPFFKQALAHIATEQLEGNIPNREKALRVLDRVVAAYKLMEPLLGPFGPARNAPEGWQAVLNVANAEARHLPMGMTYLDLHTGPVVERS